MTPEERKVLREKHGKFEYSDNRTCCVFCLNDDAFDVPYPCDVIKVLDATEPECDHVTSSWIPAGIDGDETWLEFNYCPKCGVEL